MSRRKKSRQPSQSRQQRRASDRAGKSTPNSTPAFVGGGILLAILAGWFAWQWWTTLEPVRDGAPSWNSDGTQIVYYTELPVDGGGFQADIFIMNVDGSERRNLTNTPDVDEGSPALSPGNPEDVDNLPNRYLAYDADLNGDGNFEIYIKDLVGAPEGPDWPVTVNPARDVSPAWHPTLNRLVFMSDRVSEEFDVFQIDVEIGVRRTGLERLTSEGSGWFPQFDSHGTRLALHIKRDVHVLVLGDRTLRKLTSEPWDGMYPTWSPDGLELAFMSRRNGRMELFTMNADGSEPEVLMTMNSGDAIDPRWSPDGTKIVFVHNSESSAQAEQTGTANRVLYLIDLPTGRVRRVSR